MPTLRDMVRIAAPKPLLAHVDQPPLKDLKWDSAGHALGRLEERGIGLFEVYCALAEPDKTFVDKYEDGILHYSRGDIEVILHVPSTTIRTVIDKYENLRTEPRKPLSPPIPEVTITSQPEPTKTEPEATVGPVGIKTGAIDAVKEHIHLTKKPGERFTVDQITTEMVAAGSTLPPPPIRRSISALARKGVLVMLGTKVDGYVYHLPFAVQSRPPKQRTQPARPGTLVEQVNEDLTAWLAGLPAGSQVTTGLFLRDNPYWKETATRSTTASVAIRKAADRGLLEVVEKPTFGPYIYRTPGGDHIVTPNPAPAPIPAPEPEAQPIESMTAVHPSQNGYEPQEPAPVDGELVPVINPNSIRAADLPADGEWTDVASFFADKGVEIDLERLRNGRTVVWARRASGSGE